MRKFTLEQVKDGLCRRFELMFRHYKPGQIELMEEDGKLALVLKTKKSVATAVYYPAEQKFAFYQKSNKKLKKLLLPAEDVLKYAGKDVYVYIQSVWDGAKSAPVIYIRVEWCYNNSFKVEDASRERLEDYFTGFCSASEDDELFDAIWSPDFAVNACRKYGLPGYALLLRRDKKARYILFLPALIGYHFDFAKSVEDKDSLQILGKPQVMRYNDQCYVYSGDLILAKSHFYFTENEVRAIVKRYQSDLEEIDFYPHYIAVYRQGAPYWLAGYKPGGSYLAVDAVYGRPMLFFTGDVVVAPPHDDNFFPML